MAEDTKPTPDEGGAQSNEKVASVGVPNPAALRGLAEDLPEKDRVQKAVKDGMLADTAQQEARAKARVVDASPAADETPSGAALKAVTGVSNDTDRGERYAREKAARRWGHDAPDAS